MIRNVRNIRRDASHAELARMEQNMDKATKIYKSGSREFGGEANRKALQQVRNEVINPYIQKLAADIRTQRLKKVGVPIGVIGLNGLASFGLLNRGTGLTNTIVDIIGNNTRDSNGTPLFTVNRDFNSISDNAKAFLQEAVDRKQLPGKWNTPEERELYF